MTLSAKTAGFATIGISALTIGVVALTSPLLAGVAAAGSTAAAVGVVALNILSCVAVLSVFATTMVLKNLDSGDSAMDFFKELPVAFTISAVVAAIAVGLIILTGTGAGSVVVVV